MRIICTPAILCLIAFSFTTNMAVARRGPHHPKSEIDKGRQKMDEHFVLADDHIQEDLEQFSMAQTKNVTEMTDDEKKFYYFKIHDSDNNDVLDGLELLQAATHHSEHVHHNDENDSSSTEHDNNGIDHIIDIIDDFIRHSDCDNDGFLNYPEYTQGMEHINEKPTTNNIDVKEDK